MTELIDPTVKIDTPSGVYEDMQKFVDRMKNETVDVKQLGLVGRTKEQILQEIGELYAIFFFFLISRIAEITDMCESKLYF